MSIPPRTLSRLAGLTLLGLLVACGGGGSSGGSSGGAACSGCYSSPAGTIPVLCTPTAGPNTPVMATDYDYVLTKLNAIRTGRGLSTFSRTTALDAFAQAASMQLMADHVPHAYFAANASGSSAFGGASAENQGSPTGWTTNTTTVQIDEIIDCFMSEETAPAGSVRTHFETIVCSCYAKIGVGLVKDGAGELYLTIEFSS